MRKGARLFAVDPRRTSSAQWADGWLGLDVGSDIALANAVGREIIAAGLANQAFVERATTGFDAYRKTVERYTLEEGERLTGVPKAMIQRLAHEYARAERAMLCWTLGITEHHNAVDNVLALINLALLTGHVGRYGSGLNPLRGQNNVQGGGDMGAIPNKYPGFQDVEDGVVRAKFEQAWKVTLPPRRGFHLTQMFEAMERGDLTALYVIGENPAQSEADMHRAVRLLEGLEHLVVQDIFLTKTAQMADVVLPAAAALVRNGRHGHEQRAPGAAGAQGARAAGRGARGHQDPVRPGPSPRTRLGRAYVRSRSGTSCARSPRCTPACPTSASRPWAESSGRARTSRIRGRSSCMGGSGRSRSGDRSLRSARSSTTLPSTRSTTTTRSASPPDAGSIPTTPACRPRATPLRCVAARPSTSRRRTRAPTGSRRARGCAWSRGAAPSSCDVRQDPGLRPGLAFMTLHFPDDVATNLLTIDAADPKSGTAEFKATAIRIEKVQAA